MNRPDRTTRWLQAAVAIAVPLVIGSSGFISYSSLCELAQVVGGYGQLEAHLFPFPIDFTLAGSIAASFLLARWRASWTARAVVGIQVFVAAVVTISGNALHGWSTAAGVEWLRLAVSAVPAAALVGMTHTVTIMLRNRSHPEIDQAFEPVLSRQSVASSPTRNRKKRERILALLKESHEVLGESGSERAALIKRIASRVKADPTYVRSLALELNKSMDKSATDSRHENSQAGEVIA
ncbi:MAG: hypothetical protein ACREN8_06225 [Candidatus Dormibacteraceae bacterium]